MSAAPLPPDEPRRLAALQSLRILDTPAEARFDRITRMAQRVFGVPIALISLVDSDRQWFKSCQGLAVNETCRAVSFCGHAILEPEGLVVRDALEDPRFRDNALVTGDPHIRFYAGHPLRTPDGSPIGTLCVIDTRPRDFTADDVAALRDLAALAESELRHAVLGETQAQLIAECDTLRRKALIDPLTRLWNRAGIMEILEREIARAARLRHDLALVLTDVDHFKSINDTHGHPAGDAALREVAQRLQGAARAYDAVGRYGGEEFLIVLPECRLPEAAAFAERARASLAGGPVHAAGTTLRLSASFGVASRRPGEAQPSSELIAAADAALYRAKRGGRNRVEHA